ncbi:hypothetical protein C1H46_018439 [Malus baccata]|uniref:Uncharacterized protein n=1 Tax=Malus baccata TaxID=106549 RepID=A0A540MBL9_MALBA|nr:hypothetical protein C1H46_018439 [Malus baccata]
MLGILRQKVEAGSSSAMILGQRIRPATSAMRGFASSAKEGWLVVRLAAVEEFFGSTGRSSLEIYWEDEGGGGLKQNGEGQGKGKGLQVKGKLIVVVLSPLRKTMASEGWELANRWGYRAEYKREQLAAANEIDHGDAALLPHDIKLYQVS